MKPNKPDLTIHVEDLPGCQPGAPAFHFATTLVLDSEVRQPKPVRCPPTVLGSGDAAERERRKRKEVFGLRALLSVFQSIYECYLKLDHKAAAKAKAKSSLHTSARTFVDKLTLWNHAGFPVLLYTDGACVVQATLGGEASIDAVPLLDAWEREVAVPGHAIAEAASAASEDAATHTVLSWIAEGSEAKVFWPAAPTETMERTLTQPVRPLPWHGATIPLTTFVDSWRLLKPLWLDSGIYAGKQGYAGKQPEIKACALALGPRPARSDLGLAASALHIVGGAGQPSGESAVVSLPELGGEIHSQLRRGVVTAVDWGRVWALLAPMREMEGAVEIAVGTQAQSDEYPHGMLRLTVWSRVQVAGLDAPIPLKLVYVLMPVWWDHEYEKQTVSAAQRAGVDLWPVEETEEPKEEHA